MQGVYQGGVWWMLTPWLLNTPVRASHCTQRTVQCITHSTAATRQVLSTQERLGKALALRPYTTPKNGWKGGSEGGLGRLRPRFATHQLSSPTGTHAPSAIRRECVVSRIHWALSSPQSSRPHPPTQSRRSATGRSAKKPFFWMRLC